ncbi:MAG TPA: hypothetical protein VKB93_11460, partial [Thermoanaerobaculia bacterium]|nr:hypothetical protein [Thermoanaerobaculia bacterium]
MAKVPVIGPYLQKRYWEYLARRRAVAATIPTSTLDWSVSPDPEFLRQLGYRFDAPPRPARRTPEPAPLPPPVWPAEDVYFLSVCSINHAPFTRALVESIRRHHPSAPVVVAVVDAPSRDAVAIDGAIVLTGREVFGSDFEYPSLKFNAAELCCAAKPQLIDYLLRHSPAQRFVYIDSDIYVFAPLRAMIARLDDADFVVTPHTLAPFPTPEKFWETPSLGELAHAGVFNAGMFGMRRGEAPEKFIATWKGLVVGPGAFMKSQGGQAEQNAFNWVTCFTESVAVLHDTAYNVAYWNLHDRSLRYEGGGRWTVDGEPLVAFHFSGFSPSRPWQLSNHDTRYGLYILPSVARLRDFYLEQLETHDRGELRTPYRFDTFPSGVRINSFMREAFREHEIFLRADISPWTPEGEAYYGRALLSPAPYTGSLAPILLQTIYDLRPDLRALGDFTLDPRPLIHWMQSSGIYDADGYEALFDLHRPAVPAHRGAVLMAALRKKWPRLFEGLADPMHADRREFVARLQAVAPHEAQLVRDGSLEYLYTTPISAIRHFFSQRPDLVAAFPDFLFDDAPAFAAWLREKRMKEHFLPAEAIDVFEKHAGGRPLARIFSYYARTWPLMEVWPLALVGHGSVEVARSLFPGLRHSIEFDLADIEMFLWAMAVKPWAGVALTLELPINTTRHPSSRSRAGQNEILGPVLRQDRRFQLALDAY